MIRIFGSGLARTSGEFIQHKCDLAASQSGKPYYHITNYSPLCASEKTTRMTTSLGKGGRDTGTARGVVVSLDHTHNLAREEGVVALQDV